MPISAGSTLHAHADGIHYDLASEATVKQGGQQGGQSDHTVRRATSNMTKIELSITKVTWRSHPI
jgi:hypothetical protein